MRKLTRSIQNFEIGWEEAEEKQKNGAILVDVRSNQEYVEGHKSGAICIPNYEIKRKAERILKNKTSEIIVYCQNGERSKKAFQTLKKLGYKNVFNVENGLN